MQEMQEIQFLSLGGADPLDEGMATHSTVLAWRIPWTEEPGAIQSTGSQRVECDQSSSACVHTLEPCQRVKVASLKWG